MSRNIDKANTVLFRYQEQKAEAHGYLDYHSTQRPRNLTKLKSLTEAESWRKVIIKEINEKILRINSDSNLSEYQIRDLNEDLNKLCKEKYTYEYHILHNMNGTNYLTGGGTINKYIESNSIKIKGYRYFGRARELSDVQELIERQNEIRALNSKNASDQVNLLKKVKELEERVDVHYFGYLEDIESYESHQSDVRREARNILGDLLSDSSDDEARDEKSTLSKAERKATKQRTKVLKNVETTGPVTLIESSIPVSLDQVQSFLVEKRRKELESKYNI